MSRRAMTSTFTAVNPATADAASVPTITTPAPCTTPHPIGNNSADLFALQTVFQTFEIFTETDVNYGDILTIDGISYTVAAVPRKWENTRRPTMYHIPLKQRKERV